MEPCEVHPDKLMVIISQVDNGFVATVQDGHRHNTFIASDLKTVLSLVDFATAKTN